MKAAVADYRYRVICLRIEPLIGAVIRLVQYPRDLTMGNGQTYLAGSGYEFTGYVAEAAMSPGAIDLKGFAGYAGIDFDTITGGILDNARAYLFATTWTNPVEDEEPITASILGKTTITDGRYVIEEMSLIDALNQSVGDTYTAHCPKTFGGQGYAGCKVALAEITVTGTLTGVTSQSVFRDASRTEADDYFGAGTIQFTSGPNAALKPLEIKSYAADGTIETFEPFYYVPEAGHTYTMIPGCRKRGIEDCKTKWNNILNFGGFTYIPTSSQYGQVGTK